MQATSHQMEIERLWALPGGRLPEIATEDGHLITTIPAADGAGFSFGWDDRPMLAWAGRNADRHGSPIQVVSEDGCHLAYVGQCGGSTMVGRDDHREGPWSGFSRSMGLTLSAGGERLAYGVGVVDDRPWATVRLVVDGSIASDRPAAPVAAAISRDGAHIAFGEIGPASASGDHRMRVVLDDVPGEWCAGIRNNAGALLFSPDGRRFAYHEVDGHGQGRWVVDGVVSDWAPEIRDLGLAQLRGVAVLEHALGGVFSPDSSRFAHPERLAEGGVTVVEAGQRGPVCHQVVGVVFSPHGRHAAWTAWGRKDGTVLVVVDGEVRGRWQGDDISEAGFTPDGDHVITTIRQRSGSLLRRRSVCAATVDGTIVAQVPGDETGIRAYALPGSGAVIWTVRRGTEWHVFRNSDPVAVGGHATELPMVLSDGAVVHGFVDGTTGRQTVMRGGWHGPMAHELMWPRDLTTLLPDPVGRIHPFRVSPDGRHVAWAGRFGVQARPVLDDEVGPALDDIVSWRVDDQQAVWWGVRDGQLVRVIRRMPAAHASIA